MKEETDEVIINFKDPNLVLSERAGLKILELLNRTILGSKGGMRYQLTGAEPRIKAYGKNIRFLSLC